MVKLTIISNIVLRLIIYENYDILQGVPRSVSAQMLCFMLSESR